MKRSQLAEFIKRMEQNSVALIAASAEAIRSNDTHYRYRPDSDFYYLTGFEEPDAVAIIAPGKEKPFTLFVRPRDKEREIWDGFRHGTEGAVGKFGADEAFPISEFAAKLDDYLDGADTLYYRIGYYGAELDATVINSLKRLRALGRKNKSAPATIVDSGVIAHELRVIKSAEELELMQRAADISAEAHLAAMKAVKPGMNEFEIEALVDYVFRKHGASAPAYGSIVGGGANACVLHYVENNAELKDGDLLLLDAGAEYKNYAGDITRTFPVNGKFTEAQRDIYQLVLDVQISCVDMVRPGVTNDDIKRHSIEKLTEGMVRLGLLDGDPAKLIEEKKHEKFYMHGLGHYLGMDVHDVGYYYRHKEPRPLAPGMVMTVEPGLYVAPDAENVPDKYRGIGVRIEDDVVCTDGAPRILTTKVPKEIDAIEELMRR